MLLQKKCVFMVMILGFVCSLLPMRVSADTSELKPPQIASPLEKKPEKKHPPKPKKPKVKPKKNPPKTSSKKSGLTSPLPKSTTPPKTTPGAPEAPQNNPPSTTPKPRRIPQPTSSPLPERQAPTRRPARKFPPPPIIAPIATPPIYVVLGQAPPSQGQFGAQIGFEKLNEDWFFKLESRLDLQFGKIGLGLQLPLRFRIIDNNPTQDPPDFFLNLRRQDWDHWTDFVKIVRYIRVGHKHAPIRLKLFGQNLAFYTRLGELNSATLGHGTIINHYFNNLDFDRFHAGFELDIHTSYGGFEWIMNSFFEPRVLGGRVYVRPVSFISPGSFWTRLAVGLSILGDVAAPSLLKEPPPSPTKVTNKEDLFATFAGVPAIGIDVELAALQNALIELRPYMDINFLAGHGSGFHLGALGIFKMPFSISLHARLEYRLLGVGYIPQYFDSFYDMQRYSMPSYIDGQPAKPKVKILEERTDTLNGFYGELIFRFGKWLLIGGTFDEYQGPNNGNLSLTIQLPGFQYFQVSATYIKRGFDGLGELFTFDNRSLFLAEVRVPIWKIFVASIAMRRVWNPVIQGDKLVYEPVNNFSFNVGVQFTF